MEVIMTSRAGTRQLVDEEVIALNRVLQLLMA